MKLLIFLFLPAKCWGSWDCRNGTITPCSCGSGVETQDAVQVRQAFFLPSYIGNHDGILFVCLLFCLLVFGLKLYVCESSFFTLISWKYVTCPLLEIFTTASNLKCRHSRQTETVFYSMKIRFDTSRCPYENTLRGILKGDLLVQWQTQGFFHIDPLDAFQNGYVHCPKVPLCSSKGVYDQLSKFFPVDNC